MRVLNDLSMYPEIKKYTLLNTATGQEELVTDARLKAAFDEDTIAKIKSGRHKTLMTFDYIE